MSYIYGHTLLEIEDRAFSRNGGEFQIEALNELEIHYAALRQQGMAGHHVLAKSVSRMVEMLGAWQGRNMSDAAMARALEIIPVGLDFLGKMACRNGFRPAVVVQIAENIVRQQRFESENGSYLSDTLQGMIVRGHDDAALVVLDALPGYEGEEHDMIRQAVIDALTKACNDERQKIIDWGMANQDILTSYEWRSSIRKYSTMDDGFILFKAGFEKMGLEILKYRVDTAYGDDLIQREQLTGLRLLPSELTDGNGRPVRIDATALLTYLYRAPVLNISLEDIRQEIGLHGLEVTLGNLQGEVIPEGRFYPVTEMAMMAAKDVYPFATFERILTGHLLPRTDTPEGFYQRVFSVMYPHFLGDELSTITLFHEAARLNVTLDPAPHQEKIDKTFGHHIHGQCVDYFIDIIKNPAVIRMPSKECVIKMAEANFEQGKARQRDKLVNAAPSWLFEAIPSFRRHRLSQDLSL